MFRRNLRVRESYASRKKCCGRPPSYPATHSSSIIVGCSSFPTEAEWLPPPVPPPPPPPPPPPSPGPTRLPRCCSVGSLPTADDASTAAEPPSPSRTAVAVFSSSVRLFCSSLVVEPGAAFTRRRTISSGWAGRGRGGSASGSFDPVPALLSSPPSAVRRAVSVSRIEGKPPPVRLRRSRRFETAPEAFTAANEEEEEEEEERSEAVDGPVAREPAAPGLGFF
uniref:Uncharacterized protein n=1 Tax=Anopheles coluzzii TaxID=1518534 RepID=A0A8W7PR99_ANOCL